MASPNPISTREFNETMAGLGLSPGDGPFAVAVSGGPDSMALALMMDDFAPSYFLTFDHGLRPESAREAEQVHGWLKNKGLGHATLRWRGDKPKTGVPARARAARYEALEGWCEEKGVRYLLTAHHMEDQAETVLMRLLKGSGLDGLAAMAAKSPGLSRHGIVILRPLLGQPKARLKATLKARNQPWIEDPSNEDVEFTRVKIRRALENSKTLSSETLAGLAARLEDIKGFLADLTDDFLARTFTVYPPGYGVLRAEDLRAAPDLLAQRGLSRILAFISQSAFPAGYDKVERLYRDMTAPGFKGASLQGCLVQPLPGDEFLVCREARGTVRLTLKQGEPALWDNRFKVDFAGGDTPLEIAALGGGWQKLARDYPAAKDVTLPHDARAALPAFLRGERVVAVPHLGFSEAGLEARAEFRPKRPL